MKICVLVREIEVMAAFGSYVQERHCLHQFRTAGARICASEFKAQRLCIRYVMRTFIRDMQHIHNQMAMAFNPDPGTDSFVIRMGRDNQSRWRKCQSPRHFLNQPTRHDRRLGS